MEHVFTIGINVDDDAICKAAVDASAKAVQKKIEGKLFEKTYYRNSLIEDITKTTTEAWLKDHGDEVINKAVESLVDSLKRTKVVKEKMAEGLRDV